MRLPHNAVPGSEAEARAIRAIEAYYDQMRQTKDNMGLDLFSQCADAIIENGDGNEVDAGNLKVLASLLETACRGNGPDGNWLGLRDSIVDLACILGIVPSFAEWTGEPDGTL